MVRDYRESKIAKVLKANNLEDLFEEGTPLMFQQTVVYRGITEIEGGTLCFVTDIETNVSLSDSGDVQFRLQIGFPDDEIDTLMLTCSIDDATDEIFVQNSNSAISFKSLFTTPDKETAERIEEYARLAREYEDICDKYESKREWWYLILLVLALLCAVVGISLWSAECSSLLMPITFGIGLLFGLCSFMFYTHCFDETKRGKAMLFELENRYTELALKDAESVIDCTERAKANEKSFI